jgi:hypothetical protein
VVTQRRNKFLAVVALVCAQRDAMYRENSQGSSYEGRTRARVIVAGPFVFTCTNLNQNSCT